MQVVLSDSEQEAREDGTEEKVEKRHPKPNHDKGKERTKTTVNGKRKRMPLEEEEADCSEYEPSADEKINDEDDEDYMVKAPRQKGSTINKRRKKSTNGESDLAEHRKRWNTDHDEDEEEEERPTKKRNWTESEDELLIEAVDDHSARGSVAWVRVASQIRRQRTPRYRPTAVPGLIDLAVFADG